MKSLSIFLFISLCSIINCVYIEENGYKDLTISFSEGVLKEPAFDFPKLKDVLTNASDILFHATKNRSYFENFLFAIPSSLKRKDICDEFVVAAPKNFDIYVSDSSDISGLVAQHSKGCGEKGEIIYLSKEWLTGNTQELALQFVQQWSIFRYGVFPENPERPGSCIASTDSTWRPTGCYNVDLDTKVQFDENGLPLCYLPDDFNEDENLHSSIMFSSANSSKMLNFCDGSESFPHNPVAPTLHNRICEGNSVWSVIKNTEDFKYGRNLPIRDANALKKPTFRCFKETKMHLTMMIQDTDSKARAEIRYALLYFLTIIEPADFNVSLTTFSDKNTDNEHFINLNLENAETLKSYLESEVKLVQDVQEQDVCLICGLRKAYKVSAISEYSHRIIILIARESSLKNTKISDITEIIQNDHSAILHILLLEDTVDDIVPASLVETVQRNRGRVFRLKNESEFMLNELTTALLDASKNPLHIEDKILVVHKKTYVNVTSDITDVFLTPKNAKGKLLYSMQFKNRGDIKNLDNICGDMDIDLQSPICGNQTYISNNQVADRVWKYFFSYMAGSEGTTCSSLALLKLDSSSKSSFSVKGWLNENKIIPGQNALVIYAEIYNRLEHNVKVEARISGPGLTDFPLELRDNGNGDPDIIKGDNIYSRYFTSFSQIGTYTVSIVAEVSANIKESSEMKVRQTKIIGTFRVIKPPPKEDILPPNRVCDLKAISIDSANRTVLLQWTAPGDDYDYGTAKKYTIKLAKNWMAMTDFAFSLKENFLLETEESQPAYSGINKHFTIHCPLCNTNETYYVALQAIDENYNKGRISNIVQIYFNDSSISSIDKEEISTVTSINTTMSSDFTKFPTERITSTPFASTVSENTSVTIGNQTKDGIFIERNIFIISVSSLGALILIIIILNIIICCCCCKKKQPEEPKKLSKKASMRPPHNLNIAYKYGSEDSLNDEKVASNSLSTLVNQSTGYTSSDGSSLDKRYTYHTGRSLKSKMESQSKRNDLGFKLVQPMPAYATSSLSRFVARHRDSDDDLTRQVNTIELGKLGTDETHIYPLGQV